MSTQWVEYGGRSLWRSHDQKWKAVQANGLKVSQWFEFFIEDWIQGLKPNYSQQIHIKFKDAFIAVFIEYIQLEMTKYWEN